MVKILSVTWHWTFIAQCQVTDRIFTIAYCEPHSYYIVIALYVYEQIKIKRTVHRYQICTLPSAGSVEMLSIHVSRLVLLFRYIQVERILCWVANDEYSANMSISYPKQSLSIEH